MEGEIEVFGILIKLLWNELRAKCVVIVMIDSTLSHVHRDVNIYSKLFLDLEI